MSPQDYILTQGGILAASVAGFSLLGWLASRPLRWPREALSADLGFFVVNGLACQVALLIALGFAGWMATGVHSPAIAGLPIWQQTILVFLATEFVVYWQHRLLHAHPLWSVHLVHHSSRELDWLSAHRMHPVEVVFYFASWPFLLAAGFSMESFVWMSMLRLFQNGFVHADLPWDLGPLRYVFNTPVLHRWHHETAPEAQGKNFASSFALYDVIFGTFYCPADRIPARYGVPEDVPTGAVRQIAYPLRRWLGGLRR